MRESGEERAVASTAKPGAAKSGKGAPRGGASGSGGAGGGGPAGGTAATEIAAMAAIHDFAAKLRQPSLIDRLKGYVRWQATLRQAQKEGRTIPEALAT